MGLMRLWKSLESPTFSRWRNQDHLNNHLHAARSLGMEPKFSVVLPPPAIAPSKAQENRFVSHHITSSSLRTHHSSTSIITLLSTLSQSIFPVIEQDAEMDDTFMGDDNTLSTPPGSDFGSPAPLEAGPHSDGVSAQSEIASLRRKNAALLEREGYVLRKLSRNGQGTISNIEAVVDRAVRQRDELRVENQELRASIERLESSIIGLQGQVTRMQDKLDRAESERIEMAQSRRRWIARMWIFAGRLPGELRKKDAEIDSMREKIVSMHARLVQEQSELRDLQVQLEEEKKTRMGVEVELEGTRVAHAQEIENRDLAGRNLRDQLRQMVNHLDSGAMSI